MVKLQERFKDFIKQEEKKKSRAGLMLVTYPKSKEKLIGSCTMFFHQGNYHSQVRKLVQSSLSPEVLRKLVPEIEAIAITSLESWANKQIINTFQEMKKKFKTIVYTSVFTTSADDLRSTSGQARRTSYLRRNCCAGRNAREETATPGEFVCHRLSSSISRGRRSSAMSSCHATIATPPLPELQFAGEEAIVAVELSPPGRGKSMVAADYLSSPERTESLGKRRRQMKSHFVFSFISLI
nr:abscisic acid 8'-hydroxylase 4 [Ipomoea batatas]